MAPVSSDHTRIQHHQRATPVPCARRAALALWVSELGTVVFLVLFSLFSVVVFAPTRSNAGFFIAHALTLACGVGYLGVEYSRRRSPSAFNLTLNHWATRLAALLLLGAASAVANVSIKGVVAPLRWAGVLLAASVTVLHALTVSLAPEVAQQLLLVGPVFGEHDPLLHGSSSSPTDERKQNHRDSTSSERRRSRLSSDMDDEEMPMVKRQLSVDSAGPGVYGIHFGAGPMSPISERGAAASHGYQQQPPVGVQQQQQQAATPTPAASSAAKPKREHICTECGRRFPRKYNLKRHMDLHSGVKRFSCPFCSSHFRTKANLQSHIRVHRVDDLQCHLCGRKYKRPAYYTSHMAKAHQISISERDIEELQRDADDELAASAASAAAAAAAAPAVRGSTTPTSSSSSLRSTPTMSTPTMTTPTSSFPSPLDPQHVKHETVVRHDAVSTGGVGGMGDFPDASFPPTISSPTSAGAMPVDYGMQPALPAGQYDVPQAQFQPHLQQAPAATYAPQASQSGPSGFTHPAHLTEPFQNPDQAHQRAQFGGPGGNSGSGGPSQLPALSPLRGNAQSGAGRFLPSHSPSPDPSFGRAPSTTSQSPLPARALANGNDSIGYLGASTDRSSVSSSDTHPYGSSRAAPTNHGAGGVPASSAGRVPAHVIVRQRTTDPLDPSLPILESRDPLAHPTGVYAHTIGGGMSPASLTSADSRDFDSDNTSEAPEFPVPQHIAVAHNREDHADRPITMRLNSGNSDTSPFSAYEDDFQRPLSSHWRAPQPGPDYNRSVSGGFDDPMDLVVPEEDPVSQFAHSPADPPPPFLPA